MKYSNLAKTVLTINLQDQLKNCFDILIKNKVSIQYHIDLAKNNFSLYYLTVSAIVKYFENLNNINGMSFSHSIKTKTLVAVWCANDAKEKFYNLWKRWKMEVFDVFHFIKSIDFPRKLRRKNSKKRILKMKYYHTGNLTSSVIKHIKKWVNDIPEIELIIILMKNDWETIKKWKYIIKFCHLQEADFKLKIFTSQIYIDSEANNFVKVI